MCSPLCKPSLLLISQYLNSLSYKTNSFIVPIRLNFLKSLRWIIPIPSRWPFSKLLYMLVTNPWFGFTVCTLLHPDMRHKFRQAGWESVGILPEDGSQSPAQCLESKKCNLLTCLARNGCLQLTFFNLTAGFRLKWMMFLVPKETLTMRILANSPTYRRYCRSEVKYQSELFGSTSAMSWRSPTLLRAMPVFYPDSVYPQRVCKKVPWAICSSAALLERMVLKFISKIPHDSFAAFCNYYLARS